ncbi:MAG TPA: right-handed parallel beta-helix repeat-containing protein, partial [Hanamia sp.]|nr:right-handed parallel beta-helix repeat-containing protein [Hanamia sp.]
MRLSLTILFLYSVAYGQTTYYVSNAGSDAANGLTTATAWQTIAKVNSFSFASGDTVKFNDGDTWNERLIPNSNLYFTSYGTGAKPTITGLTSVTGFSQAGNIWTKTISLSAGLNMVLINGQVAHKARYPNLAYLAYSSKTYTSISTTLTGTPNYTGGIAVVRSAPWTWDFSTITSQSGGTLNLSPNLSYNQPLQTNGYFIQGLASLVDTVNEFNYDGTTLTVYSTTIPTVQVSNTDTLVWISKKSNITFDNINFTGANINAIQFDTSTIVTVKNCSFDYTGSVALSALKSSRLTVTNNTINHSFSDAIFFRQLDWYTAAANQCDSAIITFNTVRNSGTVVGMGIGRRYMAIYAEGLNLGPYIVGNTVDSSG